MNEWDNNNQGYGQQDSGWDSWDDSQQNAGWDNSWDGGWDNSWDNGQYYDQQGYSQSYDQTAYGQETYDGRAYYDQQAYDQTYGQQAAADPAGGKKSRAKKEKKPKEKKVKAEKKKTYVSITKGGLVLLLVLFMVLTSALTFGAMFIYMQHNYDTNGTAVNYTLTRSNETLSYKSVVTKAENSVVSIRTESISTDTWAENYVVQGAGSGVIIQDNGYIMTCNHVIDGATKITVTLHDNTEYPATLVGADPDADIAIIKIKAKGLHAATYGDSSALEVGDQVIAIGNPLGELGGTATVGIISAVDRNLMIDGKTMNLMQTDAAVNPGNSGGGLFDSSGNLVGIVVAKSTGSDVEGLGFVIPINTAAEIGKNLISTGKNDSSEKEENNKGNGAPAVTDTARIGIVVTQKSGRMAPNGDGLYVRTVTGENAKAAGFEEDDRIVSLEGKEISEYADLQEALSGHKPGDIVSVVVMRDKEELTLRTTLE